MNDMIDKSRFCLLISASVEDQIIFLDALNAVAPDMFFLVAYDGTEAIEIMKEECIRPDFVFVELDMPGIDACQFLRSIKKLTFVNKVPVIVHSREPLEHKVTELKEMGAFGIYFKPYNYRSVCNILNLYFMQDFKNNLN
jgi:DNA-binding response OmpR family regulator